MRITRLLLVDDETNVLEGLRRLLRPLRGEWEVRTATSAVEALALLGEQPADVLITDMRMPVTDGGKLLALVKERNPSTVRIVLSGQTDHATALRVIPLAHQFLSKPCDPSDFIDTLRQIRDAIEALDDATVGGSLVGAVGWLPAAPAIRANLMEMLSDEDAALHRVGQVIETDPALATKFLQLTNSPFFGLRRRISSVVEATSYLGLGVTKSVVVACAATNGLLVRTPSFDAHAFQQRSAAVAHMARFIAPRHDQADDFFAAGLLHDIGTLLLASAMPARFEMISRAAAISGRKFAEEEQIAGGCAPHRRLGVYLMKLWGLPRPVVEAIANHPVAPTVEQKRLEAAEDESAAVDLDFIEAVGLGSKLEMWRARARELVDA